MENQWKDQEKKIILKQWLFHIKKNGYNNDTKMDIIIKVYKKETSKDDGLDTYRKTSRRVKS
jgi:hypothetical protein